MTTLVLFLLILTVAVYPEVALSAMRSAAQHAQGAAGALRGPWRRNVLGLAALTLLAAHVAHEARHPYAALTGGGQDEIAWATRFHSPQLACLATGCTEGPEASE